MKDTQSRSRDQRHATIDGRLADSDGRIVPGTSGWAQHPQSSRAARRLQPIPGDPFDQRLQGRGMDREEDRMPGTPAQPNVNVVVTNGGGNFYRPWKEELLISGWKSIGNLIAAPFRLVWNLLGGALRLALMFVIVPAMIFGAISFYQSHQDKTGTEMAHDVGKAGVGLVGAAFSGIWDGLFGDDEPEPARTQRKNPPASK